jgi:hypothetical protein
MEGGVRVADERIRVTAQLSSASDGFHLWSETFDAVFQETFVLQEQLAKKIAKMTNLKRQGLHAASGNGSNPARLCAKPVWALRRPT